MATQWYALRSKPNKEKAAWQEARARGFETYYPRLRVRTVNPRARQIKPYFPGYLFVKADLEAVGSSVFQYLPHANGLVFFGGEPAPVPDSLVQAIRSRIGEIAAAGGEIYVGLKMGDSVFIHDGPFAGYGAIFDTCLSGGERVRVLFEMLGGRSVPIRDERRLRPAHKAFLNVAGQSGRLGGVLEADKASRHRVSNVGRAEHTSRHPS